MNPTIAVHESLPSVGLHGLALAGYPWPVRRAKQEEEKGRKSFEVEVRSQGARRQGQVDGSSGQVPVGALLRTRQGGAANNACS